ncbi:MAG TPA: hypothetical protein DHV96_05925 [Lachnospiraceae bacterium]|nr:hypothetical protein [Lachnospiraceae bacterium]
MNLFKVKCVVAKIIDCIGLADYSIKSLGKDYIRIINYHHVLQEDEKGFEQQLQFYNTNFENVDYEKFKKYMNGNYIFKKKPGLIITFDDGYLDNYEVAFPMLKKYGFTGWYMVSSGLIDTDGYMSSDQLKELLSSHHVIGCHTYSHHRMEHNDQEEVLKHEIVEAKYDLENKTGVGIDIFCWCGGEEQHYTHNAAQMIKRAGYKYSFMTNAKPVVSNDNKLQLERSNVEAYYETSLMKFQLSFFNDLKFKNKRKRVEKITNV